MAPRFHRDHAVVELAIRDLKEGAGLDHDPSGNFQANSVWLQTAVLANNLIPWAAQVGARRVASSPFPGPCAPDSSRSRADSSTGAGAPSAVADPMPWADTSTTTLDTLRLLRPAPASPLSSAAAAAHPPALTTDSTTIHASTRPDTDQRDDQRQPPAQLLSGHRPEPARRIEAEAD